VIEFGRLRSGAEAHLVAACLRAGLGPGLVIGHRALGRWTLDLAWPTALVAAEVDGTQHRTARARAADERRDRAHAEEGWWTVRHSAMEAVCIADDIARTLALLLAHRLGTGPGAPPLRPGLSPAAAASLERLRTGPGRRWRIADLYRAGHDRSALAEAVRGGHLVVWVNPRLARPGSGQAARLELPRGAVELDEDGERAPCPVVALRAPAPVRSQVVRVVRDRPGMWAVMMAEPLPGMPGPGRC
jgi:very-short-patch-repair endonuclease